MQEVCMKKIISLLLILCTLSTLFGCNTEPEVTETEPGTIDTITAIIDTETTAAVTAPDETTSETTADETVTEPDETTEETSADTEPARVFYRAYSIYDPGLSDDETQLCSLMLFTNGQYSAQIMSMEKNSSYKVFPFYTETGEYEIDENVGELTLNPTEISYFIETDMNKKYRQAYLDEIEESYSLGVISKKAYEIINKAIDEPYVTKDVDEFKGARVYKSALASGGNKAVLDETTAYFLIPGIAPSDNEYYIAENGYMLALYDDKTCSMRHETERREEGFGTVLVSEKYDGTYEINGTTVNCVITKNKTQYSFTDNQGLEEYKAFYTEQYESGKINKIYYDYYMSLISEEGNVTDDLSDVYLITIEPHTHTAVITGSPETEA